MSLPPSWVCLASTNHLRRYAKATPFLCENLCPGCFDTHTLAAHTPLCVCLSTPKAHYTWPALRQRDLGDNLRERCRGCSCVTHCNAQTSGCPPLYLCNPVYLCKLEGHSSTCLSACVCVCGWMRRERLLVYVCVCVCVCVSLSLSPPRLFVPFPGPVANLLTQAFQAPVHFCIGLRHSHSKCPVLCILLTSIAPLCGTYYVILYILCRIFEPPYILYGLNGNVWDDVTQPG